MALAVLLGCGSIGSDRQTGSSDAGSSDAGSSDAGSSDAGSSDAGSSDAGSSPGTLEDLQVIGLAGDLGSLAWVASVPDGYAASDLSIQAWRDDQWVDACVGASRCVLANRPDLVRAVTTDGTHWSAEVAPRTVQPSLSPDRADGAYWADEDLGLTVDAGVDAGVDPDLASLPIFAYLSATDADGTQWWSDANGWVDTATALDLDGLVVTPQAVDSITQASLSLIVGVPAADWAAEEAAAGSGVAGSGVAGSGVAGSGVAGSGVAGSGVAGIGSAEATVFELGHRVLWGDPHVHTDLSHDGCEDPLYGCQGPDSDPAADVFTNAEEIGLDWAAMADHSEWNTYVGSVGSTQIDIWTQQQAIVRAAEASHAAGELEVIPFLGYEWTFATDDVDAHGYRLGGHHNLIFEDSGACTDWRVNGRPSAREQARGWSDTTVNTSNSVQATSMSDLHVALRAAAKICGDQRVLVIAHHPALLRPQPVDWRLDDNIPDPTWEGLVEIASEHGASECYDLSAVGCDFEIFDVDNYYPEGSYQAALMSGFRLGVVGGTDAHDAKPGSVDDGPSCTAIPLDDGSIGCHNYGGAQTGVLTLSPYDATAVFDGLALRKTFATTGPEIAVRAWLAVGSSLYLPGRSVSAGATRNLTVSLIGAYDSTRFTMVDIDLLTESGELLATAADLRDDGDALLQTVIEPGDCSACYVRVRLATDEGQEDRVWLSPWFF